MDWKKQAKEKLRRYRCMKTSLENLAQELESAADEAYRLALRQQLMQAQCWVETVERGLCALSEAQRYVLQELYIDPQPRRLDRLCSRLNIEQAQVYRRRDAALERFTTALFGCANDEIKMSS